VSVRAMEAGAVAFLTKPFREEDLLGAIGQAIERESPVPARKEGAPEGARIRGAHSTGADGAEGPTTVIRGGDGQEPALCGNRR
jgi:DNA-binding NtrC family response regulator